MSAAEIPSSIGRFEILDLLGRGGVGSVYLARDPQLDRKVAIKTLTVLEGLPDDEQSEARARFLREARAAAALNHPNIVTIFEVGEQGKIPFIAMEYLEGRSLDRHTKKGHLLEPAQVLRIGMQAAAALGTAHAAGIVHRDIKPANLVLLDDGTLKVMDFGLAKDPRTTLTSDQALLGTPGYMSPEQVAGRRLDGRTDLFSLAVSLYELLAGERPFPGDTVSSVLYRIVNEPPVPLARVAAGLPAELGGFFMRALAKDLSKRPESGEDFARQLRAVARQLGEDEPTGPLPPPGPREQRATPAARADEDPTEIVSSAPSEAALPKRPPRRARWVVLSLAVLVACVVAAWTAPLWSGLDPLGGQRQPMEDWLSANLGGFGDALRTTPPDQRVQVETDPPGLPLRLEPEGIGRFESGGLLVLPGRLDESVQIIVDDPCREGSITIAPGEVNGQEVIPSVTRRATIRVTSEPSGAAVTVNGDRQPEPTPTELNLELCRAHEIALAKQGFVTQTLGLEAEAGVEDWSAALGSVELRPPEPATVVVPDAPYEVLVYASGQRGAVGRAGEKIELPARSTRLTLLGSAVFFREVVEVSLRPGESTRVPVRYPPLGRVSVRSVPPGALVEVRDHRGRWKKVGETSLNGLELVAGEHELRVTRDAGDGPSVLRRVNVGSGENDPVLVGKSDWNE